MNLKDPVSMHRHLCAWRHLGTVASERIFTRLFHSRFSNQKRWPNILKKAHLTRGTASNLMSS